MEEIYANVEWTKHAEVELQKNESRPRRSKRSFVSVSLCLLSLFLLAGLAGLAVAYGSLVRHSWDIETSLTLSEELAAERDSLITNLTQRLQTSREQLSAVTEERDSLRAKFNEKSRELEGLRAASTQRGNCSSGWTGFSGNCYLLSTQSLSWENASQFCIREGSSLVTIDNAEEQNFVSEWTTSHTWIGLNDREKEGAWRWSKDDSPLGFWSVKQPDAGNGDAEWGDEDCVHIEGDTKKWNDRRCDNPMKFICEKNT